jgi:hypothetical protein
MFIVMKAFTPWFMYLHFAFTILAFSVWFVYMYDAFNNPAILGTARWRWAAGLYLLAPVAMATYFERYIRKAPTQAQHPKLG